MARRRCCTQLCTHYTTLHYYSSSVFSHARATVGVSRVRALTVEREHKEGRQQHQQDDKWMPPPTHTPCVRSVRMHACSRSYLKKYREWMVDWVYLYTSPPSIPYGIPYRM